MFQEYQTAEIVLTTTNATATIAIITFVVKVEFVVTTQQNKILAHQDKYALQIIIVLPYCQIVRQVHLDGYVNLVMQTMVFALFMDK